MAKLTDTQAVVLSAAFQRPGNRVLPLPDKLKGGAAQKVVQGLLKRDLIAEVPAGPGDPVWREAEDGRRLTLVATDAAAEALGLAPDSAPEGATEGEGPEPTVSAPTPTKPARGRDSAAEPPKVRPGTKQARLIAMLEADDGATIAEIAKATGWQNHAVRGAISGALKKRLGLPVTSETVEGRGRVYRISR